MRTKEKNHCPAHAFYIVLNFFAKQQREMTKFYVFSRTWERDRKIFSLFPFFDAVHGDLVPKQFAGIFQVKKISIIAKERQ